MKINNYLLEFGGLLAFLTVGHAFVVFKYFQVLIHHSIYYCQEMAKALNMQLSGDLGKTIVGVLALAALFSLIKIFVAIFKVYSLRKFLSGKIVRTNNDFQALFYKLKLCGNVHFFDERKPQAFCFGIRKPKIYISTGLVQIMNEKELEVILRHEKYHLENRDSLILMLAAVIESLFPFFPVVSDLIRIYRTDREIKADLEAVRGAADKKSLAEVFKKLLRYEPTTHPAFTAEIFSIDTLEARIQSFLLFKTTYKKVSLRNLLLSIVSLGALIGLMVTPVNAIELHEEGRDVVMLCNASLFTPVNFSSVN